MNTQDKKAFELTNNKNLLQEQIIQDSVSHAYLFCGPKGCGKFNFAKIFIKEVFKQKFNEQIDNNTFADLKIYSPSGSKTYLISQVKDIVKESQSLPQCSDKKFIVIKDADLLGTSCANALLKSLEEPIASVHFILLTNNEKNVLETVLSRCQIIKFKMPSLEDAIKIVIQACGVDSFKAKETLELFGQNTNTSIEYLKDHNMQNIKEFIFDLLFTLKEKNNIEIFQKTNSLMSFVTEICDSYKAELDDKIASFTDIYESSEISMLTKENKSLLSAKKNSISKFIFQCIKNYYDIAFHENNDNEKYIKCLVYLDKVEHYLEYNISIENFCNVVFLNLKRIL